MGTEELIKETLKLAKKGFGRVSPNPMVGAVIVKNGKIISRGYHRFFGGDHAEVDAISRAENKVKGSTLYINLEPCCFHGKTPPCTELIVGSGIKKVVIGDVDPNPNVRGKGIDFLRKNGIEVVSGVLRDECRKLNEVFYKYMETSLPFIAVKIAQTIDGKISEKKGKQTSITSPVSRRVVHKLRSIYDAVLIGKNTAVVDDPSLTVRLCNGRSPRRILLDEDLKINPGLKLLNKPLAENTIVFTTIDCDNSVKKKLEEKNVQVIIAKKNKSGLVNLKDVLKKTAKLGISSVMVEGGADVFSAFISQGLVDKLYIF
ncbi:bifunctional diaminohydroxyphosphoribosylaminopyrimidine deaminase/5-amino-6-(5-phosphoribosylamino)uracil reductase RibD, partial [bacterium]|nr:bifunctional diaminohydroxyphosphoribosylaminopyrimidine deaminase/5-amino-6-(5-phosphoribosylamino)uracil reductase RibD [bacterium]